MNKTCNKCQQFLDVSNFSFENRRKNILSRFCKPCQKIARRTSYLRNKDYYVEYSKTREKSLRKERIEIIKNYKESKPCKDCGLTYPHYVMDFDHLPNFEKEIAIGSKGCHYSITRLLKEFDKCDVVCSNCHRVRTWSRMAEPTGNAPVSPLSE